MQNQSYPKYRPSEPVAISDRIWPTRRLASAPIWSSVDLRDGNQAFARPMNVETKLNYFKMLCDIGFREIEVGFPAASQEEFEFVRRLIEEKRIPDGVRITVFTAARQDLIDRTIASIAGVERAMVHCYVATSDLHREFVFGKSRAELIELAVQGTVMVREALMAAGMKERVGYEFSPEEFSDSDLDFIVELAEAVKRAWGPAAQGDYVLNLPATVERRPPYEFADLIELFCRKYDPAARAETIISVHTHNDQGCAVAAAEMAILAGAERVEGTLCGHGERTGNMDLVTFALNLTSRGIDTGLTFRNLPEIVKFIEQVSEIDTYPRAPYTGELVFTAFSGTHQDAIRKGMARRDEINQRFHQGWKVPYLHLDPADIGRSYDGLIRINSQSGKGGVAYVLETFYNINVPKAMQPEVARAVQQRAEANGGELSASAIYRIFCDEFVNATGEFTVGSIRIQRPAATDPEQTAVELTLTTHAGTYALIGAGSGPIEAAVSALHRCGAVPRFEVESYSEHALGRGADARAAAFLSLRLADNRVIHGVGVNPNVNLAAIAAITSALNRATAADQR